MNRIRIIKRKDVDLMPKRSKRGPRKVTPAAIGRGAANAVGKWVDDLRSKKPEDARHAFSELFRTPVAGWVRRDTI